MRPRDAVRAAMATRRVLLGAAVCVGWSSLAGMLALAQGTAPSELGRGGVWLGDLLRAHSALLWSCMAAAMIAVAFRRLRIAAASAMFAILWLGDFAVRKPGGEHGHVFALAACGVYALIGALRGFRTGPAAERTAWEGVCALIGAAYLLTGIAKVRYEGLGWIDARYMQVLVMSATAQARGLPLLIRQALAASPRILWFGAFCTLTLELLGPLMAIRRARFAYLLAFLAVHLGIFVGMGITMFPHLLLLVAAFPFEEAFLLGSRTLAGARRGRVAA